MRLKVLKTSAPGCDVYWSRQTILLVRSAHEKALGLSVLGNNRVWGRTQELGDYLNSVPIKHISTKGLAGYYRAISLSVPKMTQQ